MNKLGIIFPGQGSQYVGMGKDLYTNFKEAKALFDKADDILAVKVSDICFNGPETRLRDTLYQQLAVFLVSSAAWEIVKPALEAEPEFFAGLSLGEYTAVYASGMLDFEQALKLVQTRAELMEKAAVSNPSVMLAVLKLSPEEIKQAGLNNCYIANLNSPSQVVVSVAKQDKDRIIQELTGLGAKRVVELNLSGGFHSPFMEQAVTGIRDKIEALDFTDSRVPVVSNVDAQAYTQAKTIKKNLLKQMVCPVLWQKSVEYMSRVGVKEFYEIGPGQVLKGLLRKIDPCLKVENFGRVEEFKNLKDTSLSG
jgi:[acyl-carrier-protein] S-malonyltransferase